MSYSRYNTESFSRTRRTSASQRSKTRRAPDKRTPKSTVRRKPSKQKHSSALTLVVILLIAGLVFLIGVVSFNFYREYRKGLPFTYSDGVNVSGIDIAGKSEKEAEAILKERALDAVKDVTIKIRVNGKETVYTKADFKYSYDFETPLKEAKTYSMKEQGIYPTEKGETAPSTQFSEGANNFTLNYKIKKSSINAQLKKLSKPVDKEPKNARVSKFHPFESVRFEYQQGVDGCKLDSKTISNRIIKLFSASSNETELNMDAKINKIAPSITVDDLKKNIVGLSTASTVSQNTEDGTHNMKVAMKACNGSVIEPGATWSFNGRTGDSNLESNGYKKAAVISQKKIEQGTGGGICQASTIIFEAGLFSNMEIVERHNHYWASTYAYAGEDATIDYPDLDLRMRNKTKYQMFMECRVEDGNRLRVNIWGYQDPAYDNIRIHSENYEINDKDYHTRLFRELFKNGEIIKNETICDSTYNIKYSVKVADAETFRTKVDGTVQYEDADYTPMEVVDNRTSSAESDESGDDEDDESSDDGSDEEEADSENE